MSRYVKKLLELRFAGNGVNPFALDRIQPITTTKWVGQLNRFTMKKKVVGLALLASLIISVTSGCIVRQGGYHHYRHHDHDDYRGYRDNR